MRMYKWKKDRYSAGPEYKLFLGMNDFDTYATVYEEGGEWLWLLETPETSGGSADTKEQAKAEAVKALKKEAKTILACLKENPNEIGGGS